MVGRHAAAREAVEEDRHAELLRQRAQRHLAVAPVEVRARHHDGPLGLGQQPPGALDRVAVGAGAEMRLQQPGAAGRLLRLAEDVVHREVEERRPGVRRHRDAQRLVDHPRDLRRRVGRRRELRQRPHERHVVDLLQRAAAPAQRRRATAEHEHGRVVRLRRPHRAERVGHARAGRHGRDPGRAGDLRPALRGEGGGLLVAHVDDVDALLATAVVDREDVAAREREQLAHAVGLEAPCDQPAAVQTRLLRGVSGHAGDARCSRSGRAGRPVIGQLDGAAHVAYEARMTDDRHPCTGRIASPMMAAGRECSWHELLGSRHRPDVAGGNADASQSARPATHSSPRAGTPDPARPSWSCDYE